MSVHTRSRVRPFPISLSERSGIRDVAQASSLCPARAGMPVPRWQPSVPRGAGGCGLPTVLGLARSAFIVFAFLLAAPIQCLHADGAAGQELNRDKLTVMKQGDSVSIRSRFSDTHDLLRVIGRGRNNKQINFAYTDLVPKEAEVSARGVAIHYCGDDACPWLLNNTYIGGNHGDGHVRALTSTNHGLTVADIGSAWKDATGTTFYAVEIVNTNEVEFLSENKSDGPVCKFTSTIVGDVLTREPGGQRFKFSENKMTQLWPACRIRKQEYLVNGETPLRDGEVVTCDTLDITDENDVIDPASVLAGIIKNPGKEPDFIGDGLGAIVRNTIVYRFFPDGGNVILYKARALQEFSLSYMGFFQTSRLRLEDRKPGFHEYYIPKTVPFEMDGTTFDFRAVQDLTQSSNRVRIATNRNNVEDPQSLPDRFVQFVGHRNDGAAQRKAGYAVGYSLISGVTVPAERAANNTLAVAFGSSIKTYASAISSKINPVKEGTEFECIAYRIYFNPARFKNATCVYWYREGDATVVYADYHKSVDRDVIELPQELTGKSLAVIEKTPSLTLHTPDKVPERGVEISVKDYGYVVLKVE